MIKAQLRHKIMAPIMALSALFFFQDVANDIREHIITDTAYSFGSALHLFFEILATIGLTLGLIEILTYIKALQKSDEKHELQLKHLTEDFDALVHKRFDNWDLTAAEKDIALFMLRGLSNIEIADLRNVAVGTVRVQSHRILQKAGASSRTDLMSMFMEEFMDVGSDFSSEQLVSET